MQELIKLLTMWSCGERNMNAILSCAQLGTFHGWARFLE